MGAVALSCWIAQDLETIRAQFRALGAVGTGLGVIPSSFVILNADRHEILLDREMQLDSLLEQLGQTLWTPTTEMAQELENEIRNDTETAFSSYLRALHTRWPGWALRVVQGTRTHDWAHLPALDVPDILKEFEPVVSTDAEVRGQSRFSEDEIDAAMVDLLNQGAGLYNLIPSSKH